MSARVGQQIGEQESELELNVSRNLEGFVNDADTTTDTSGTKLTIAPDIKSARH